MGRLDGKVALISGAARGQGASEARLFHAEGPVPASITDTTLDEYRRVIEVNQVGTFLGMRAAIPLLLESGGGSIVTVASVGGTQGVAGMAPYTSSKFAVRGLTRVAALELAQQGIRVNTVIPGSIDTAMMQPGFWGDLDLRPIMAKAAPMGRVGQPEEVAELVCWLASDASSYCTGAEFTIDGGYLAGPVAVPPSGGAA